MSIVNRDLSWSERCRNVNVQIGPTVTGTSALVAVAPFACKLVGAYQVARGLSGTPTHQLAVEKFIVGSGATVFTGMASTLTAVAFGTSGAQGFSMAAASFISLNAGDIISVYPAGTNAAVADLVIGLVLEAVDDIKKTFSVPSV